MSMHQITPYYPPSGSDQRTYYNSDTYYSGYSLPPTQAPHHPDASVYQAPTQQPYPSNNYNSSWGFASPPPPTLHEVYSEFGSHPNTNTTVDLLDTSTTFQPAPYPPPQESRIVSATPQELSTLDDIPADIIASQERAMAEAKQRALTRTSTTATRSNTTSQALVPALPPVPESNNPTGSDAVHPDRLVWKQTRGTKTAAGAASGAIVGGVLFGPAFPVGMVLGGAAGGYVTNKLSKHGERRAQRKWEQTNYQRVAAHSQVAHSSMV